MTIFQAESINLDPELQAVCEGDVRDHCNNVSPGQAQVKAKQMYRKDFRFVLDFLPRLHVGQLN